MKNRLMCWLCSRRLTYIENKPVFSVIIDPIGAEHKVHKFCAKEDKSNLGEQRRKDFMEFVQRGETP